MKILTLNIWGAPFAKHRPARIASIIGKVIELDPDILLFQEVYLPDNRQELIEGLFDTWRHYHYFPSALIGSGLLTMSKYRIVDAVFHQYRMQGKPDDLMHGDYYVGKGIGLTRIDSADGVVDVYNSHTHAQYLPDNDNEYAAFTESNLYEAARFIDSQSGASPVILAGDLNTRPDQAGYRIITQLGALVDAGFHVHEKHCVTYASDNPYTNSMDQTLDYVLVRNIAVDSVDLVMSERLIGEALSYSDHYGLLATIHHGGEKLNLYNSDIASVIEALHKRISNELLDSEAQQMKHIERAIFGIASILDGFFLSMFIGRYSKRLGKAIRQFGFVSAVGFAIWQIIQAQVNLQNRKNKLEAIQQELEKQIKAKRLFDGREWD